MRIPLFSSFFPLPFPSFWSVLNSDFYYFPSNRENRLTPTVKAIFNKILFKYHTFIWFINLNHSFTQLYRDAPVAETLTSTQKISNKVVLYLIENHVSAIRKLSYYDVSTLSPSSLNYTLNLFI